MAVNEKFQSEEMRTHIKELHQANVNKKNRIKSNLKLFGLNSFDRNTNSYSISFFKDAEMYQVRQYLIQR